VAAAGQDESMFHEIQRPAAHHESAQ